MLVRFVWPCDGVQKRYDGHANALGLTGEFTRAAGKRNVKRSPRPDLKRLRPPREKPAQWEGNYPQWLMIV